MRYLIIMDSGGDISDELSAACVAVVPLTLKVDEAEIVDDENFDQLDFLERVAHSQTCPSSACPSPGDFLRSFERDVDRIYVVTLSSMLSGSYNSACIAAEMLREARPDVQTHVFDSKSASAGEALVASVVMQAEAEGQDFETVVAVTNDFIARQTTCFVLEDLSFLQKNGRLTGIKYLLAEALHVVPILCSTDEGSIRMLKQVMGYRKAIEEFWKHIAEDCIAHGRDRINISHCNCLERAEKLRDKLLERLPLASISILKTRGVSSLYAGNHGLVASY